MWYQLTWKKPDQRLQNKVKLNFDTEIYGGFSHESGYDQNWEDILAGTPVKL